jgi:hypothetical protein
MNILRDFSKEQGELRESLKQTDYAWMAGFIDGEGYIGMKKGYTVNDHKYHSWSKEGWYWVTPTINVCNTDYQSLKKIGNAIGANVNKRKKTNTNLKSLYTVECSSREKIKRFLPNIMPYLIVKKKQAELVYRLVCLPPGTGSEKLRVWEIYDKLITENGQKAVGRRNHKKQKIGNPEPSFRMKQAG